MKHLIYSGVISIIMLIYSIKAESKIMRVLLYFCHLIAFIFLIASYIIF